MRLADFADDASLTMPPKELAEALRPATLARGAPPGAQHRLLRVGEAVMMVGPCVHAAPLIRPGVWRPVLFVSGYLPDHPDFAIGGCVCAFALPALPPSRPLPPSSLLRTSPRALPGLPCRFSRALACSLTRAPRPPPPPLLLGAAPSGGTP